MHPEPAVVVIAKAPLAGRAKTRLSPPCTPEQAATLAEAALLDTLDAVAACRAGRRVLAFEGDVRPWVRPEFEVVPQRGAGLGERLASAMADAGGAALLVGMDTPQVTPALLDHALDRLGPGGEDAVLGLAADGGFWAVGLRHPEPSAFLGVPMSTARTGGHQRRRLEALGRAPGMLPVLRDVDVIDDALAVAAEAPGTRFAARVAAVAATLDLMGASP